MRKIYLGVLALYLGILSSHAQTTQPVKDTTNYETRKLKLDEVNFVSGYYHQNGNNSAVTGGIGTENLTDFANTLDIQMSKVGRNGRKNTFTFELGIDHYTSASSDKIDPYSISSASRQDTRVYPSLNWTSSNEKTGNAFGFTGSYSHEFDYQSRGLGFNLTRVSKDKNTQFDFKLQAFLDTWKVILPVELRPPGYGSGSGHDDNRPVDYKPRNSFSASFSLSQVLSTRLQALFIVEPSYQKGLLATKYQRDYFTDGSERVENLPDGRYKLPIGVRFNYFLDDHFVIRTFYRYYMDNWGIRAHTAEIEVPIKFSSFVSVSPFYRYNTQVGTRYFAPYGQHDPTAVYYTSDYDLSSMHSNFVGANLRLSPPNGVFGWQHLNTLELRYGHYMRSTGLNSDIVTLALKFK
ncbi:DUF3570 domain-containing protein [Mucilaginibacter sp. BJC16-A38]|uniref:DUF3570 domain-containing protein n=1 Tax=Mucilaginibacter phenanthrenivorans TaxID=1234842 RepID=UPI00215789F3|nr:DUF3570 domain-containing protein [Mucilaginibacter phenanthrenivorans]MCR8560683.1 DUF3570 domain-containing protein [Mucilaginibacter phenanthrenivorans]